MTIINFWADNYDYNNDTYLAGHIGFFWINFFLIFYDLIFEFYIHGRFTKNTFTILAFIGSCFQVLSCIASIRRYNIQQPFHRTLGFIGIGFGEIGFLMMIIRCIITVTTMIYKKYNKYTKSCIIFAVLLYATNFGITYITYDKINFKAFRPQVIFSLVINMITSILLFYNFRNKIRKVQIVCFILFIICGMGQLSGMPIFIYPGTGVMYIANTILAIYTGDKKLFVPDTDVNVDVEYRRTSVTSPSSADQHRQENEQLVVQQMSYGEVTFCTRIKLLLSIIYEYDYDSGRIMIIPTAIRVWFYLYFLIFFGFAYIISSYAPSSKLDFENNVVKNTFGFNNICVVVDYPPFTLFGTTLWIPALLLLLLYSYFDYICICHDYKQNKVSKKFFTMYKISTIFEALAFSFFTQITATAPTENAMIHTVPFLIGTFALWTMSFKHHCYLDQNGVFSDRMRMFGIIYQVLLISVCIFKSTTDLANLLLPVDGKLFMLDDWKWTLHAAEINDRIFLLLTLVLPVIFEYLFVTNLKVVNLISSSKFIFKSDSLNERESSLAEIETLKL